MSQVGGQIPRRHGRRGILSFVRGEVLTRRPFLFSSVDCARSRSALNIGSMSSRSRALTHSVARS